MDNVNVNIENEMVIIANLVLFPENRNTILSSTNVDDYQISAHKGIFLAVKKLASRNTSINDDIVASVGKNLGYPDVEYTYLQTLRQGYTAQSDTIEEHISVLRLDAVKTKFKETDIKNIIKGISKSGDNLSEIKELLYSSYLRLVDFESSSSDQLLLAMDKLIPKYREEMLRRDKGEGYYLTGFHHLDQHLTEGYAPKKITVIGARPGCGKSSFVYDQARRLANQEVHVFIFTLEMESYDLLDKYIAAATGIEIETLVKDRESLTPSQRERIDFELDRYERNPYLHISDSPSLSIDCIVTQIQRKQAILGITYAVCIIDLFGQVSDFTNSSGLAQQYELNLDKVKKNTKLLGIHTVLVNQINRSAERVSIHGVNQQSNTTNTTDEVNDLQKPQFNKFDIFKNRPSKSQLKNSGKLEEVADNIFLLFRGKYYDDSLEDDILEVMIEKQRKGKMNISVYFEFHPARGRILPTKKLPYDKREFYSTFEQGKKIEV